MSFPSLAMVVMKALRPVSAGGLVAGLRMFKAALKSVVRSPLAFFDTTPMGRILSRFSKDQETLDNELAGVLFSVSTSSPYSKRC